MIQNKIARGTRKVKVNYLLSGIIRCGNVAMQCMVIKDHQEQMVNTYHIDVSVEGQKFMYQ